VSEIETLCRDGGILPGQEALGAEIEGAYDYPVLPCFLNDDQGQSESLDDRAVRDCFLRFFCSILVGYERYLVVPDMDFLISGNEWFDTEGFLAASHFSTKPFLRSFVETQLFQSFIQRRTEASDVRCLLFDECVAEFHSSKLPYGRLGESVAYSINDAHERVPTYSLLVDQCAADASELTLPESDDISNSDISHLTSFADDFMLNNSGDLVTAPSRKYLPIGCRYLYCVDGNPCFPQKLDTRMFHPREPERLSADLAQVHIPVLTRSDRELDESRRRRKLAGSRRGAQKQRRCLLQLPKLMVSVFHLD